MKKTTTFLAVSAIALTAASSAWAQATLSGDIGFSIDLSEFNNSDDSETDSLNGYALDGTFRAEFSDWVVSLDASHRRRGIDGNSYDSYAPEGASALGLHFGRQFGDHYLGAFAGRNWFQGDDAGSAEGYVHGKLYGIEGQFGIPALNGAAFAQVGRADMVGDAGDSEFDGKFVRIGMMTQVNDRLGLVIDAEYGRSPDIYEDDGDWGEYRSIGVRATYRFQPRLIGELGLESMKFVANTEDSGWEDHLYIGLRVPFGGTAYRPNTLTTTYKPGLAAAWAEALD